MCCFRMAAVYSLERAHYRVGITPPQIGASSMTSSSTSAQSSTGKPGFAPLERKEDNSVPCSRHKRSPAAKRIAPRRIAVRTAVHTSTMPPAVRCIEQMAMLRYEAKLQR
jgi:hypothetical protein